VSGEDGIQIVIPSEIPEQRREQYRRLYLASLRGGGSGPWGRLPKIYAEALLAAADARGVAPALADDLDALVHEVFPQVEGLEVFWGSPAVSRRRKDELIVQLFEGKAEPLFVDFLRLLNRKDRLGLLRPAVLEYWNLLEQRAGRRRVLIDSASALEEYSAERLANTLASLVGGTPVLMIHIRPELIGGLIVRIGDRVFDTSLLTRLQSLRHQLLTRGSHEIQNRRDRFCIA